MGAIAWRARAAVLVLVGAVAVHRLVYATAGVQPDAHAHAYLSWLTPALFALLLVGVAEVGLRLLGVHRRPAAPPPRARVLWPALSVALVAVFAGQEAAEAVLAPGHGHHHALTELLLSHGLWTVGPVAVAVAGLLALALRGAAAADAWALAIVPLRRPEHAPLLVRRPSLRPSAAPADVLARNLAGRGPPAVVV